MDELIEKHFKQFESNEFRLACFSFYMATGKVNGNFLLALRGLLQESEKSLKEENERLRAEVAKLKSDMEDLEYEMKEMGTRDDL
jgi:cell division protein FtsB